MTAGMIVRWHGSIFEKKKEQDNSYPVEESSLQLIIQSKPKSLIMRGTETRTQAPSPRQGKSKFLGNKKRQKFKKWYLFWPKND